MHDVLACVGMEDTVAVLAPGQRDPHDLTPTGTSTGGRIDRIYLTWELAGAASRCSQQNIGDVSVRP